MVCHRDEYLRFIADLPDAERRETDTYIIFATRGKNFCWVPLPQSHHYIQIFPPLGRRTSGNRFIEYEDGITKIINRRRGEVEFEYIDPGGNLEWKFSYVGFSTDTISFMDGCNLIEQAYNLVANALISGDPLSPPPPGKKAYPPPHREASHKVTEIRDSQRGITYEGLFGDYISGVRWIKINDPYIRKEHQVRNVEELLNTVGSEGGYRVELVTMFETKEESGANRSIQQLNALKRKLINNGIEFSYSFEPQRHDRFIETDEWKIFLSRGLDIFYPDGRAKECQITYILKRND